MERLENSDLLRRCVSRGVGYRQQSARVLDTGSSHARKPHGSGLSADSTPGCSSAACVWRIHGEFLSSYMMVQEH